MSQEYPTGGSTTPRTGLTTLAAVALVVSPILAVIAMAMFPDTSDEIAMVQTSQWLGLWALGLGASLLFALGTSGIFGSVIGDTSDRTVRFGVLLVWIAFAFTAIMFALNVTTARMLVVPESTAVLPAGQQQFGLDIVEAVTSGLYVFAVAFAGGAALLLGRAVDRSSPVPSLVGTAGQTLGILTLVAMTVVLLVPEAIGFEIGFLLTFLLGIVIYVWGLVVGVSIFRTRSTPDVVEETA